MSGFAQALPVTLAFEGGFSDNPADRGGATMRGVTQATYDAYRQKHGLPEQSVEHMADDEMQAIYHTGYWLAGKCDALPWPVSLLHFDACVNHGPANAARILQRAAGAEPDGILGPKSLAAVDAMPPMVLADAMLWERLRFYARIIARDESQGVFAPSWIFRTAALREHLPDDVMDALVGRQASRPAFCEGFRVTRPAGTRDDP